MDKLDKAITDVACILDHLILLTDTADRRLQYLQEQRLWIYAESWTDGQI